MLTNFALGEFLKHNYANYLSICSERVLVSPINYKNNNVSEKLLTPAIALDSFYNFILHVIYKFILQMSIHVKFVYKWDLQSIYEYFGIMFAYTVK